MLSIAVTDAAKCVAFGAQQCAAFRDCREGITMGQGFLHARSDGRANFEERVSHAHTPNQWVAIGRDVECAVLARAVNWHIEHRVMLHGRRTVVFA